MLTRIEIFRAFLAHSGQIIKEKLTSSRPKRNNSRPGILHLTQFKSLTNLNDGESINESESGSSMRRHHESPPGSVRNSTRSSMIDYKDDISHSPDSDDDKVCLLANLQPLLAVLTVVVTKPRQQQNIETPS